MSIATDIDTSKQCMATLQKNSSLCYHYTIIGENIF